MDIEEIEEETDSTPYLLPFDLTNEFIQVNNTINCITCKCELNAKKRSQLTQHLSTSKHLKAKLALCSDIPENVHNDDSFNAELFKILVATNIPIFKINHPSFKSFLRKYIKKKIPDESTLRRQLKGSYETTITMIRQSIHNCNIWLSVDETTDMLGRCVIIVVIGPLLLTKIGQSFCLNVKFTDHYDNTVITQTVIDSLQILWPDGIQYEKVQLFLTDGAAYMSTAASNLKLCFNKLIHVTCFAHGLNRVCEFIRSEYQLVDKLVSKGKKVFLKAPHRRTLFKQIAPGLPLPPEPCITRWGTWLSACIYYNNHINIFKSVVSQLNPEDAQSIYDLQQLLGDPDLNRQLYDIVESYSFLVDYLRDFQSSSLQLANAIQYYREIDSLLLRNNSQKATKVYDKFLAVIYRNTDFNKIVQISDSLNRTSEYLNYSADDLNNFQSAPITTCEVERRFSQFKLILSDRRTRFTEENLKMYFVVQANEPNYDYQ